MKSFLFEKYGYYPTNIIDNSFEYKGFIFTLTQTDINEEEIKEVEYVNSMVYDELNNGSIIIKNRSGNVISFDGEQNYVLWAVKKGTQNFINLFNLHLAFHNKLSKERIQISELLSLWEEKFEFIETRVIPTLRSDDFDYGTILEGVYFAFGLAENALQYLADAKLDFGNFLEHHTLVHKRLNDFSNSIFFDPFNYMIDSPIRDLAELYKANKISLEIFLKYLDYYDLDTKEASVLMARILFPTKLFDTLERHYIDRKNIKKEILDYRISCEMELVRLKNMHLLLVRKYGIRPIIWLEK